MSIKLESLCLAVSSDNSEFSDCFEITSTAIQNALLNQRSEIEIISTFVDAARKHVDNGKFKAYRIRIKCNNKWMYLSDVWMTANWFVYGIFLLQTAFQKSGRFISIWFFSINQNCLRVRNCGRGNFYQIKTSKEEFGNKLQRCFSFHKKKSEIKIQKKTAFMRILYEFCSSAIIFSIVWFPP